MSNSCDPKLRGMLTTADLGKRLGHEPLLAGFVIHVLKVEPEITQGRANYWTEEQFQLICRRWSLHGRLTAEKYDPLNGEKRA